MRLRVVASALIALVVLAGCDPEQLPTSEVPALPTAQTGTAPLATLIPTSLPTQQPPVPALPGPADPVDTGWLAGEAGTELRLVTLAVPSTGRLAPLVALRADPTRVWLRVGYAPEQPQALDAWRASRGALAAINGGFFTPEQTALGLTVSAGQAHGSSREFGGMFAVDNQGAPSIRDLAQQPYDGSEGYVELLQSFPMLVRPGGQAGQIEENGERNRRSAVALDGAGRVLLIVAPTGDWTLQDLADALVASDLAVERALNLDGGSSTGLVVHSGQLDEQVPAFTLLPQVLLVEPR
jgi:uncharacterized protein YigE (DUF2233 family)